MKLKSINELNESGLTDNDTILNIFNFFSRALKGKHKFDTAIVKRFKELTIVDFVTGYNNLKGWSDEQLKDIYKDYIENPTLLKNNAKVAEYMILQYGYPFASNVEKELKIK